MTVVALVCAAALGFALGTTHGVTFAERWTATVVPRRAGTPLGWRIATGIAGITSIVLLAARSLP